MESSAYLPSSSVTAVCDAAGGPPVTVNLTPGKTFPVVSRTTPPSRPAGCADAASTPAPSRQTVHTNIRRIGIRAYVLVPCRNPALLAVGRFERHLNPGGLWRVYATVAVTTHSTS